VRSTPVEFLTDDEAAAYGRYAGPPSQVDLERVFFLDDEDRKLVDLRRGDHMKAGFALQLVTVRWLGTFLEDPLDVPGEVLDFVGGQLGIADLAVVKRYTERVKTKSDHQREIRRKYGLRDFADAEAELTEWVAARAWTSGDGPKAIFLDAMTWLRERKVLLPGVTTLVRLVARVRDETTHGLWHVNRAQREAAKDKARKHPRLARASARLAVAVEALFESDGWGAPDEEPRVSQVWQAIEAVVSRSDLRAALTVVSETVPSPGAEDPDDWRAGLLGRYQTIAGFLKLLPSVILFGATAEGTPVLAPMRALPDVLAYRGKLPAPLIPGRLIDESAVNGLWRRLVFGHPAHEGDAVSRHAYAFCILEQFWRGLKRRDIYADASTRWRNPQARLLEGQAWAAVRADVLTTLGLPADPGALPAEHCS